MTKDIFLSLKGLQFGVNEQTEELETITPADYYLRNGSHYVVYDELLEGCEDIVAELGKTYKDVSEEEIEELIGEIETLKERGELFSEDIYENYIIDVNKRQTVVKALCLHIAHDCNLACKYCFAGEGEYQSERLRP